MRRVESNRASRAPLHRSTLRRIEAAMNEVVIEVAKENDYKAVLPRAVVVASHDSIDITDEVLQRLNKKIPMVNVSMPAAAAPATRR